MDSVLVTFNALRCLQALGVSLLFTVVDAPCSSESLSRIIQTAPDFFMGLVPTSESLSSTTGGSLVGYLLVVVSFASELFSELSGSSGTGFGEGGGLVGGSGSVEDGGLVEGGGLVEDGGLVGVNVALVGDDFTLYFDGVDR